MVNQVNHNILFNNIIINYIWPLTTSPFYLLDKWHLVTRCSNPLTSTYKSIPWLTYKYKGHRYWPCGSAGHSGNVVCCDIFLDIFPPIVSEEIYKCDNLNCWSQSTKARTPTRLIIMIDIIGWKLQSTTRHEDKNCNIAHLGLVRVQRRFLCSSETWETIPGIRDVNPRTGVDDDLVVLHQRKSASPGLQ